MEITFDPAKREATLLHRQLDFVDAAKVFEGAVFEETDLRPDYGEERTFTVGRLKGRLVVVVWTQRGDTRRIISMRHAHAKESRKWIRRVD